MWKIVLGFIVFAAIVLWVLTKSGADIDMSGEKHGIDPAPAATEPAASVPALPASAASQ